LHNTASEVGLIIVIAALMVACVPAYAMAQAKSGPPEFDNARYDEDYSYLRDPANWTGAWWERYKFMPLDPSGTRYLTLGADLRPRYEHYVNRNWGDPPDPTDGYGWLRIMPYADLHLGPNIRLFGQLIGAWAFDMEPAPSPVDETGADLLQAFGQLRFPGDTETLMLQGGRQLLAYGSERLIGLRFGPNVPQAFDGGLARIETGPWRADTFFMLPVRNDLQNFDDGTDDTRKLWSLYATRSMTSGSESSGLDVFYIGFANSEAVYEQGSGSETRHTLGTRVFDSSGNWNWNHEAHFQFGTFADGNILAWSVATDTRYTFADVPLKPYIELRANAISGDRDPNDTELNSFNAMFPKGKYFGEIGLIGPRNLLNLHPVIGVSLGQGWSLRGAAVFFWRESLGDGVYDNPGNLLRASGDSRARYIGTQSEVVLGWTPVRGIEIEVAYSEFEPGRFIGETGPSKTVRFVGAEIQLRF
jgi:hypothetical protein